jgi:hypothetical protein
VTITVGLSTERLLRLFRECERVGVFPAPHGVASEEEGQPFHICTGQRAPWPQLWPSLKSYRA